jgi:hypothetical protein
VEQACERPPALDGISEESPVKRGQAAPSGPYRGLPTGLLPLIVPLTLLKHHLNRYTVPDWMLAQSAAWVPQQIYYHPYPKELMLRNHV